MWRRLHTTTPLITAKPTPSIGGLDDVVRDDCIDGSFATAGNAVGSPLLGNEYDPVTTDPKGEASVAVTVGRYARAVTNLEPMHYAGSWLGNIHFPSYISGYFDGEGCFSVALSPRSTLRVGWEVRPSVSVSQNADRSEVLEAIHGHFGCGSIRPDPGDATVKWESRSISDLVTAVLPHFRMYPLLSGKSRDFESLDTVCGLIGAGRHLSIEGMLQVVELARMMNPSGRRRYDPDEIIQDLRTR